MKSLIGKNFLKNLNKTTSNTAISTISRHLVKFLSTVKHAYRKNDHLQKFDVLSKEHGRTFSFIHNIHDVDYDTTNPHSSEDDLFEMFKNEETGLLPVGKFLCALKASGLRETDPRLKETMETLEKTKNEHGVDTQNLNLETFRWIVSSSIDLISQALRRQFIIPEFQNFCEEIEDIYWNCKENTNGTLASYIPQLKSVSPDFWGVSICTIDGQRFSIGDVDIPFTIQSCSKPITYGIALDLLGEDVVHEYVGQEPSGRNFNELLLDHNSKFFNPDL